MRGSGGIVSALVFAGGLAQLARAPALQAGGQRFESVILHFRAVVHLFWCFSGTQMKVL